MKLHWRIQSLPELDHLSSEQRTVLLKKHVGIKNIRLIAHALFLGMATIGILLYMLMWPIAVPLGVLVAIATYLFEIRLIRVELQSQIIEAYRGQQLPICLRCGYDLRGVETSQCPECGSGVRVKLKSPKKPRAS